MEYLLRVFRLLILIISTSISEYKNNNVFSRYAAKRTRMVKEIKFIYFTEGKPLWYNILNMIRLAILRRLYRLDRILFFHQTTSVRLFYGLTCLSFMAFFGISDVPSQSGSEYYLLSKSIPVWLISTGFGIVGISTLYGVVERKVDKFLFYSEAVLGLFLWMIVTYYVAKGSGITDIDPIPFFMSLWLFFRYPTHRKKRVYKSERNIKIKEVPDGDR